MVIHELVFETSPRDQGQIFTYSYATTQDGVIVRRDDGSDRSIHYFWNKSQRRLTAAEMERYGLAERG